MDNDEFNRKLLEAFSIEADEHLKEITRGVLELEKSSPGEQRKALIERTFREAHSLKGAARAVNRADVESVCQALEGVLAVVKSGKRTLSAEDYDVLNGAIDLVGKQLAVPGSSDGHEGKQAVRAMVSKLRGVETAPDAHGRMRKPSEPSPIATAPQPEIESEHAEAPAFHVAETVRIPVAKMNSLLLKVEGMVGVKLATRRYASELREAGSSLEAWKAEWKHTGNGGDGSAGGHVSADFSKRNGELIGKLEEVVHSLMRNLEEDERSLTSAVDDLLADTKTLLLLPFATLLDALPKQVRDLSRDQGKEVDLVIKGREVEIDKRILDEMKDVLIHLVRNAIDHGIEKPDVRVSRGKALGGKVSILVQRRDGNRVAIEVEDDGGGIDVEAVMAAAARQGGAAEQGISNLSREAALGLIYQSGVSTAPIVTELSGRGLGMAIVREKVEKLGGQVTIHSDPGIGTTFRIVLPVTLATFKGIVVSVSGQTFVIPTSGVEQIVRVDSEAIRNVENRPTVNLNGRVISLAVLADVLEIRGGRALPRSGRIELVVLGAADKRVAFVVDEVITEQEVLVKPLSRPLVRVRNVSNAAVLGSGKPALVLNVSDLLKSAVKLAAGIAFANPSGAADEESQRRVLVADDSVTSRMLLKNILESAGYLVATVVDGLEAFSALQRETFDILVSDVEMPRMNGFELTTKVRADRKMSDLPVVLVTALGSREDRDRGIDVGASAYIVKSAFDQNNLIEIVRRLVA